MSVVNQIKNLINSKHAVNLMNQIMIIASSVHESNQIIDQKILKNNNKFNI